VSERSGRLQSRLFLQREPLTLALLTGSAVLMFLFVVGLSRFYHNQQQSLALRWSSRGSADLQAQKFTDAVSDFRTALLYSRDNYSYQLSLAEALLGEKRTDEAYAYLINLWGQQPEDGLVNLELARIAAGRGETERALRYYHNAIYATWPDDLEIERRTTRLELVQLLLRNHATAQAQSELIALAANLRDDPPEEAQVGELFLQALDYRQALTEYELSLKDGWRSPAALAGAGQAAFELGQYPVAHKYLQEAVAAAPRDTVSAARLRTTELVLHMDPFRQQIPAAERDRIVVRAFAAAGKRLDACPVNAGSTEIAAQPNLAPLWEKLDPQINIANLRRNPDLVNSAMELVFKIERQASYECGASTGTDTALLLIANLHEGL